MALDKLPYPLVGSLRQEGEHLSVAVGIAQPRGKVVFIDALCLGLCPPRLIEGACKVYVAELCQRVKTDGD